MNSPTHSRTSSCGTEPDFILHPVQFHDTLAKLALKYGVTVADIKQANKLYSDQIYHLSEVKIPAKKIQASRSETLDAVEKERRRVTKKLHFETRLPKDECRHFLQQAEWRYDDAVRLIGKRDEEAAQLSAWEVPDSEQLVQTPTTTTTATLAPIQRMGSRELRIATPRMITEATLVPPPDSKTRLLMEQNHNRFYTL